jgi:LPXTG-site transpeptidase (sortase) family protein
VLVRAAVVLMVACLVAVFGGFLLARSGAHVGPLGWLDGRRAVSTAAAAAKSKPATSVPAPRATPDDLLAQALAIVAPAAPPAHLVVPTIGVNAVVEPVGLDGQGRMSVPSSADRVAWYSPGATPGDAGNAVLAGHLDWTNGPAVFWRLGTLRKGDEVTVLRADGTRSRFVVDSTAMMPYDAATDFLYTKSGAPSLTLITCAGTWDHQRSTYLQRLVVRTSLVSSAP